ncbi:hypothetical protein ACFL6K_06025 [Candidatus Latescibacterota bacterium]
MAYKEKNICSFPGCKNYAQQKGNYCYDHSKKSKVKTTAYLKKLSFQNHDNDEDLSEYGDL